MRKNKNYIPKEEELEHADAVLKLMGALTGDERFEHAQNVRKGGVKNMCEVFDYFENKGKIEGKIEGKLEGEIKGKINVYYNDMHLSVEEIAKRVNKDVKFVKNIIDNLN